MDADNLRRPCKGLLDEVETGLSRSNVIVTDGGDDDDDNNDD
jgi:hypothetical protein